MSSVKQVSFLAIIAVLACVLFAFPPQAAFADNLQSGSLGSSNTVQTQSDSSMRIYPIYLGASKEAVGDCVLLESNGSFLLMDLGSLSSYNQVKSELQKIGVKKLSLYISHFHADHTGGLGDNEGVEKLFKDFQVEKVYFPDRSIDTQVNQSTNYAHIQSLYTRHGGKTSNIIYLKKGSRFTVGAVSAEVLGPVNLDKLAKPKNPANRSAADTKSWENNTSLTTMFTCGSTKFLTTGDTEVAEEKQLVAAYGSKLKADVLKMGHHGYTSANSEAFIKRVKPSISFITSAGDATRSSEVKKVADSKSPQNGLQYLGIRSSVSLAQQYGIVYVTGLEQKSLRIDCSGSKTFKMRYVGSSEDFSGWTKLHDANGYLKNYKSGDWISNYLKSSGAGAYSWYYIGANGKPKTGMAKVGGKLYNFGTGGAVEQGSWVTKSGNGSKVSYNGKVDGFKLYYVQHSKNAAGYVATGKTKIDGKYYYFNTKTGKRTSGLVTIGKKKYYFGNDGAMWKNKAFMVKGKRYYATKNGSLASNAAVKVKGVLYLYQKNCVAMKGTSKGTVVTFKGEQYKVYASGRAVKL